MNYLGNTEKDFVELGGQIGAVSLGTLNSADVDILHNSTSRININETNTIITGDLEVTGNIVIDNDDAIVQNGNAFGENMVIGTNDDYAVIIKQNNFDQLSIANNQIDICACQSQNMTWDLANSSTDKIVLTTPGRIYFDAPHAQRIWAHSDITFDPTANDYDFIFNFAEGPTRNPPPNSNQTVGHTAIGFRTTRTTGSANVNEAKIFTAGVIGSLYDFMSVGTPSIYSAGNVDGATRVPVTTSILKFEIRDQVGKWYLDGVEQTTASPIVMDQPLYYMAYYDVEFVGAVFDVNVSWSIPSLQLQINDDSVKLKVPLVIPDDKTNGFSIIDDAGNDYLNMDTTLNTIGLEQKTNYNGGTGDNTGEIATLNYISILNPISQNGNAFGTDMVISTLDDYDVKINRDELNGINYSDNKIQIRPPAYKDMVWDLSTFGQSAGTPITQIANRVFRLTNVQKTWCWSETTLSSNYDVLFSVAHCAKFNPPNVNISGARVSLQVRLTKPASGFYTTPVDGTIIDIMNNNDCRIYHDTFNTVYTQTNVNNYTVELKVRNDVGTWYLEGVEIPTNNPIAMTGSMYVGVVDDDFENSSWDISVTYTTIDESLVLDNTANTGSVNINKFVDCTENLESRKEIKSQSLIIDGSTIPVYTWTSLQNIVLSGANKIATATGTGFNWATIAANVDLNNDISLSFELDRSGLGDGIFFGIALDGFTTGSLASDSDYYTGWRIFPSSGALERELRGVNSIVGVYTYGNPEVYQIKCLYGQMTLIKSGQILDTFYYNEQNTKLVLGDENASNIFSMTIKDTNSDKITSVNDDMDIVVGGESVLNFTNNLTSILGRTFYDGSLIAENTGEIATVGYADDLFFKKDGNSFAADVDIGTTDNKNLTLIRNNINAMKLNSTGVDIYHPASSTTAFQVGIDGGDTYIGLDTTNNVLNFEARLDVQYSIPVAGWVVETNADFTTCTLANTFYIVQFDACASVLLNDFTLDTVTNIGRLTYDGTRQIRFQCDVTLNFESDTVGIVTFKIEKNAATFTAGGKNKMSVGVANDIYSTTWSHMPRYSTNDYIELWVEHSVAGATVTVENLSFNLRSIPNVAN